MESDEPPAVTDHAGDQWDTRAPPGSVAPETAWEQACRLRAAEPHVQCQEARYHRPTDTLLLRINFDVVTVLDVATCSNTALQATVRDAFGAPQPADAESPSDHSPTSTEP